MAKTLRKVAENATRTIELAASGYSGNRPISEKVKDPKKREEALNKLRGPKLEAAIRALNEYDLAVQNLSTR